LLDLVTRMIAPRLPVGARGDAYWSARMGNLDPSRETKRTGQERAPEVGVAQSETPYETRTPNGLRYVAQVRHSLLLCESEGELLVLHRERADATRLLDALTDEMRGGSLARQNLLFPDRMQLPEARARLLDRHGAILRALGFEWSQLGEGSYVVRAAPARLAHVRSTALIEAALDALCDPGSDGATRAIAMLARAGATSTGEPLSDEEARALVGAIWPSRREHQGCIVARIPLPTSQPERVDD
jgi:DNA mismatch repair protein MutL